MSSEMQGTRPSLMGVRVPRVEDHRLLVGTATFVADIQLPRMLDAAFVRSPSSHALIASIKTQAAASQEGVLGVFTAADLDDVVPFPDFFANAQPVRAFPLCRDRVLHAGAAVAVVVAEDRYMAEDAVELVELELDELPPVASAAQGLSPDAPRLHVAWPDNRMIEDTEPRPEVDAVFDSCEEVVAGTYYVQRQAAVPMETRGVVADYRGGRLTVWTATQFPHIVRTTLSYMLPLNEREIRVVAPDVGGGFGGKCQVYPEEVVVAWLAYRLGRPVRYIEDRAEHMLAAVHARDETVDIEAAVDADGHILALRGRILQDLGTGETFPPGFCPAFVLRGSLTGPYRIRDQRITVTSVVTNKTPSGAYRGFGMPEATFVMERILDKVAGRLAIDPIEIRRRNLIRTDELPYVTASGARLDSGSHLEAFERTVDWGQARVAMFRNAIANEPHVRVGLGVANYVEGTVGSFFSTSGHWTSADSCQIRFDPDGGVTVSVGVCSSGQGLETMAAMLASETLGVSLGDVRVVMGDTDGTPYGLGSWGARSLGVVAGAVAIAGKELVDKGIRVAAHMLEVAPDDVVLGTGGFHVSGSPDRFVAWRDVAHALLIRTLDLPPDVTPGLESRATYEPPNIQHLPDAQGKVNGVATHTNSTHAAILKVDIETGEVHVLEYLVTHDCGRILNKNLVEGQVQGGVAQGIGGALYEDLRYDEGAQPLAGTFMDYLLPLATDIPDILVQHIESPAPEMPLGMKGAGEAGIIGPAAAVASAIENALAEFGVAPGDLTATPFTPAVVRELLAQAKGASGSLKQRGDSPA